MSQHTGAFTIELDTGRLADEIATRVVEALHAAAREATEGSLDPGPGGYPVGDPDRVQPGGGEHYDRTEEP